MSSLVAFVLALGVSSASAQPGYQPSPKDNPEAYWSRGFGCSPNSESYNISIRVPDIDAAVQKIDAMMTTAGAPSQLGQNNGYYNSNNQRGRQISYSMPTKNAEKLSKRLIDFGELLNYSFNRQNPGDAQKQIEERIAIIEGELANADAMAKLPTAAYFLRSRLTGLKQMRETCLAAGAKTSFSVYLTQKNP